MTRKTHSLSCHQKEESLCRVQKKEKGQKNGQSQGVLKHGLIRGSGQDALDGGDEGKSTGRSRTDSSGSCLKRTKKPCWHYTMP